MAIATFTASAYTNPVRQVHAGVNSRFFGFNSGATACGTSGDSILLCKLPNKVRVTGCSILVTSAAAGTIFNVCLTRGSSISTTLQVLGSFTTSAAAARFSLDTLGLVGSRRHVSFSDVDLIQHATLALVATAGASATVSVSLEGTISYYAGDENA